MKIGDKVCTSILSSVFKWPDRGVGDLVEIKGQNTDYEHVVVKWKNELKLYEYHASLIRLAEFEDFIKEAINGIQDGTSR